MKVEEITIKDKNYPEKLRNIYDPPQKIFVIGNTKILNEKAIAIVGSRKATNYGKTVAFKLSNELSQKHINVISGLAIGIDTYAHLGVLYKCNYDKGKTIAVLGSGLDNIYPKENTGLARQILKNGGCIISEYPFGTKPEKVNFPQRNRIISGLSNGIVVVQADRKSGALITAELGLEQGKEIFAVPGEITNPISEGTNNLILQGAKIVLSVQEILEEIK